MLAAADWVIYAIPIIAFLVWLLSTALRPSQPPPPARPARPRGGEPVVFPEAAPHREPENIPVVQPVQTPTSRRNRLEEILERRRRGRGAQPRPQRPPATRTSRTTPIPEVQPQPTPVIVEPVVILPQSAIVYEPPQALGQRPETLATELRPQVEAALLQPPPPMQPARRGPSPALVVLGRFLRDRENFQAAFLLREVLGPPKALHWLARGRPR